MNAADTGRKGESLAAADYVSDGYSLVAKNYRTRFGEVDLILKKGVQWVFAEVKTRTGQSLAAPREWVNTRKQQKVMLAAQGYLQSKGLGEVMMRFDVVEVVLRADGSPTITRIENAFGA